MSDLVNHGILTATEHVYACWIAHSGQAGVTSLIVRCDQMAAGRRVGSSPAREYDPSGSEGPLTAFALRPGDEITLTSNGAGDQIASLALLAGTALQVEGLLGRG